MIEFERTKKLAKIRKMSLREVNDKAKLGTNTIYNWKSKKPGSDALAAVAKVLNTTTDYLKGLTDDHNPSSRNKAQADLDDDTIFTFQGRPIPPEDLKIIRRLLKNDDDE
ncbi:helix-turn-helix transcriptional regulator [Lactobacillus johnsonii]|uniref:helix-turn-helix transcriptional regulator n=1 Tax=Lactobacillus johnsonii TaxID=33959 RepID=UPI00107ED39A|nr:helix-turn-helix transcriptional regulator [Lactobacillus johnsonii]TGA94814.1 XRE family transcriptional regulator [Lactobacillus johnsonii]